MGDQDANEQTVGGRGARVLNTALSILHEGEIVLAAAGSEAQAERVIDDALSVIHYHFPVEIEVRTMSDPVNHDDIARTALLRLAQSLRSLRG